MAGDGQIDAGFGERLGRLGPTLLRTLEVMEYTLRHLHPPQLPALRPRLAPVHDELTRDLEAFSDYPPPAEVAAFHAELVRVGELARDAIAGFALEPAGGEGADDGIGRAILSMHRFAEAQAALYPLRAALPPFSAFFAEPAVRGLLGRLEQPDDGEARGGLFRGNGSPETGRGGFDLYVPESFDGAERLPLIVALHGGSGNGADFLWTWLREARSRRCLLLAPTSRDRTWSLNAPAVDGEALVGMVDWIDAKWGVDRERVLLTGLSDGGTMTLLVGLGEDVPFTHLAPIAGVLHPLNFAIGNLDRAEGKPIQLIHGALDWMFPVRLAREAAGVLEDAGAEFVYREIEDLSHTYPREENARLLDWLGQPLDVD